MTQAPGTRPLRLPLLVLTGPFPVMARLAEEAAAHDIRVFAHSAVGGIPHCLCCAGESETTRQLEMLLRDIDNGRSAAPAAILLAIGEAEKAYTSLATIEAHPYFRLRFEPLRLIALGDGEGDHSLPADAGIAAMLSAIRAPAPERSAKLRERLYRLRLGAHRR